MITANSILPMPDIRSPSISTVAARARLVLRRVQTGYVIHKMT
jgi:hypothetical protein